MNKMCKFFFQFSYSYSMPGEVTSAKYLVCIFLDLHAYIPLTYSQASDLGILLCLSGVRCISESWQQPQHNSFRALLCLSQGRVTSPSLRTEGLLRLGHLCPVRTPSWSNPHKSPVALAGLCSCSTASDSSHPVSHPSSSFVR